MNWITSLFLGFNAYTHSNPVLAGVASLWGLSLVTVIFRKIPARFMGWVYGQITTTLELDNSELGFARDNYAGFMAWYMARKQVNFTRHFSVLSVGKQVDQSIEDTGRAAAVGVGNGTHYFIYRRRLCKMNRRMLEKSGRDNNIFVITITMFSRNKKLIHDMVEEFCHRYDMEKQRVFRYGESGRFWSSDGTIRKRPLKTVIANAKLKQCIISEIEDFLRNRQWYYDRGLPYKLTFVLHGLTGGGKTSLIKALAAHFGLHIARISLADMTDSMLEKGLSTVPAHSIVLIEDFDSVDAVKTREALKTKVQLKRKKEEVDESTTASDIASRINAVQNASLTLSGVLNALDGVVELDDTLIFMTTNVLQDIDPAVIRKGRVDKIYEVPALTHPEIVEYIELMFPNVIMGEFDIVFDPIMGADLQAIYFDHPDSVYDFIGAIPGTRKEGLISQLQAKQFKIA
jgi:chaperone BCS1